jgi:hypothetical protein
LAARLTKVLTAVKLLYFLIRLAAASKSGCVDIHAETQIRPYYPYYGLIEPLSFFGVTLGDP